MQLGLVYEKLKEVLDVEHADPDEGTMLSPYHSIDGRTTVLAHKVIRCGVSSHQDLQESFEVDHVVLEVVVAHSVPSRV